LTRGSRKESAVQVHVLWIVLGWVGILSFMVLLVRAAGRRGRVRARVFASLPGEDTPVASTTDEGEKGWLGRWLGLAYRADESRCRKHVESHLSKQVQPAERDGSAGSKRVAF